MDKFKRKIHARVPIITVPGLSASPFFGVFPQEDSFGVALEGEEEADDDGDGVLRCIIIRKPRTVCRTASTQVDRRPPPKRFARRRPEEAQIKARFRPPG